MIKFTKEEISLCKQVAEKHRKEIARGDYYVGGRDKKNRQILALSHEVLTFESLIPLWTISDCLEFLEGKFQKLRICSDGEFEVEIWWTAGGINHYGKTPLEACLKAVLAVLKEVANGPVDK